MAELHFAAEGWRRVGRTHVPICQGTVLPHPTSELCYVWFSSRKHSKAWKAECMRAWKSIKTEGSFQSAEQPLVICFKGRKKVSYLRWEQKNEHLCRQEYLPGLLCRVDPEVHSCSCRWWDDIELKKKISGHKRKVRNRLKRQLQTQKLLSDAGPRRWMCHSISTDTNTRSVSVSSIQILHLIYNADNYKNK